MRVRSGAAATVNEMARLADQQREVIRVHEQLSNFNIKSKDKTIGMLPGVKVSPRTSSSQSR